MEFIAKYYSAFQVENSATLWSLFLRNILLFSVYFEIKVAYVMLKIFFFIFFSSHNYLVYNFCSIFLEIYRHAEYFLKNFLNPKSILNLRQSKFWYNLSMLLLFDKFWKNKNQSVYLHLSFVIVNMYLIVIVNWTNFIPESKTYVFCNIKLQCKRYLLKFTIS